MVQLGWQNQNVSLELIVTQGLRPQFSHLLQLPDHVAGQCWHRPDISGLHVYQHLSIDGGEATYVKDAASKINLSFK